MGHLVMEAAMVMGRVHVEGSKMAVKDESQWRLNFDLG